MVLTSQLVQAIVSDADGVHAVIGEGERVPLRGVPVLCNGVPFTDPAGNLAAWFDAVAAAQFGETLAGRPGAVPPVRLTIDVDPVTGARVAARFNQ